MLQLLANAHSARKNSNAGSGENSPSLIAMREVVKVYRTPAGQFTALDGISLRVGKGEFVAVVGKSGSGKSTLINMLTGIDHPSGGEVWVNGVAIHTLNENQIARWRGRNVGVVFQFFQLLPTLTLLENVKLPMDLCSTYPPSRRAGQSMRLLEMVGLAGSAHRLPSEISGGQQQRVAIARALANDPALIVADEPTGNLDSRTADAVFQLFEALVADSKTIVMVTHDNDLAARASRVVELADGAIIRGHTARHATDMTGTAA